MADDVQPETGTGAVVAARLCNFKTGYADLLVTHKAWLDTNVKPALAKLQGAYVNVYGYASHLGNSQSNMALSQRRLESVKAYVSTYASGITFKLEVAEGELDDGLEESNDDGYYRAAEIFVYGTPPPPVRPKIPRPTKLLGSKLWQIRSAGGISAMFPMIPAGQVDVFAFLIEDRTSTAAGLFVYTGQGFQIPTPPSVPLPPLSGGKMGPPTPFATSREVHLPVFEGAADLGSAPGASVGSLSVGGAIHLEIHGSLILLRIRMIPKTLKIVPGSGVGVTIAAGTAGFLKRIKIP
jgi:hypothetical protein